MKNSRFSLIAVSILFIAFISGYTSSGFAQNPFSEGPFNVNVEKQLIVEPIVKTEIEVNETAKIENEVVEPIIKTEIEVNETAKVKNEVVEPAPESLDAQVFSVSKEPEVIKATAATKASEVGDEHPKILDGYADTSLSISGDNYCAQYAMSSVLKGFGITCDPQKIYEETNPAGIFTAPPTIVKYLNKQGVSAQQRHNASTEDITDKIDSGKPVIVLVESGDGIPHWVNIYGYDRDENGKITSLTMRDSYWGTSKGHVMEVEEFKKKWEKPFGDSMLGTFASYKNLMIDVGSDSTGFRTPPQTATEDSLAGGINEVITGWTNRDLPQLGIGLNRLLTGIPGAVTTLGFRLQSSIGERIAEYGRKKLADDGVVNKAVGGLALATGKVVDVVGKVGQAIGNGLSTITNSINNGLSRLFK